MKTIVNCTQNNCKPSKYKVFDINMIDELNKRIIEVMVRTEHTKSTFAKALDVSLPLITHITTGRNKPGLDIIQKILTHFESISPDWLLLGTGDMYREKAQSIDYTPIINELDQMMLAIREVENTQKAVIQYHKILLDEVLHLSEIDKSIMDNENKLEGVSSRMKVIQQNLKSI